MSFWNRISSPENWRKVLSSMTMLGLLSTGSSGCAQEKRRQVDQGGAIPTTYKSENSKLLADLKGKGIKSDSVLQALGETPRHMFVPESIRDTSYQDEALPIGLKQTISQPYIVAYMTEILALKPDDRVLEVGTGSGYQAAVLSRLVEKVYSVELLEPLAEKARSVFSSLGIDNIEVRVGDGYKGWKEHAPFDAIIVTAAPKEIPEELVKQLKDGGRMVLPVGMGDVQWLVLITRQGTKVSTRKLIPVRFVPMVHGVHGVHGVN